LCESSGSLSNTDVNASVTDATGLLSRSVTINAPTNDTLLQAISVYKAVTILNQFIHPRRQATYSVQYAQSIKRYNVEPNTK